MGCAGWWRSDRSGLEELLGKSDVEFDIGQVDALDQLAAGLEAFDPYGKQAVAGKPQSLSSAIAWS
ncbi:hypothetical protein D3C85_1899500 [compost metagenome]